MEGFLMSKDIEVAYFSERKVTPILNHLVPVCFRDGKGDMESWLANRAIDSHRPHSRVLKKVLRLRDWSDLSTVLRAHAATVTDCYWVKLDGESLCWNDVKFSSDYFSELALRASAESMLQEYPDASTPELTNTGSFEKCWKLLNGRWFMYKRGDSRGYFSEILTSELGDLLGFHMAQYFYNATEDCVVTPDFTDGMFNLEPMFDIIGDVDDEELSYRTLMSLSPVAARRYLDLLFMDNLVMNVDRHTNNYGILREQDTGHIFSIAPNYDNNLSLIGSVDTTYKSGRTCPFIPAFKQLLKDVGVTYTPPTLELQQVQDLVMSVMPQVDLPRAEVANFIWANYQELCR